MELTSKEKLIKLGIKNTSEFGDKNRQLLNKINKNNDNGEYVGYQLNLTDNELIVIGKKGTISLEITNYDDLQIQKGLIPMKAKMIHYEQGGNTPKAFNYSIGGL